MIDRILKLIRKVTGAPVSDMHGKPLALNPEDNTFMNHCGVLYCSDQVIAERMIGSYRELVEGCQGRAVAIRPQGFLCGQR